MAEVVETEKWEYKTRTIDLPADDTANLAGLGDEGWELVTAVSFGDGQCELFFKRLKVTKRSGGMGFGR